MLLWVPAFTGMMKRYFRSNSARLRTLTLLVVGTCLLFSLFNSAWAVTLQAEVAKSQYLPPDLYGQWQIEGHLIETNAPYAYAPVIHEIWLLQQQGDHVVLANPISGASAWSAWMMFKVILPRFIEPHVSNDVCMPKPQPSP